MVKKRKSLKSKTAFALFLIVFAVILFVSIETYKAPPAPPPRSPDEYFAFSEISALAESVDSDTIRVKQLYFKLTAVKGDANHLVIFTNGMTDPTDYYHLNDVKNGTTTSIEITFPYAIQTEKSSGSYPIDIRIRCDEADGWITLHVAESDVIIT